MFCCKMYLLTPEAGPSSCRITRRKSEAYIPSPEVHLQTQNEGGCIFMDAIIQNKILRRRIMLIAIYQQDVSDNFLRVVQSPGAARRRKSISSMFGFGDQHHSYTKLALG